MRGEMVERMLEMMFEGCSARCSEGWLNGCSKRRSKRCSNGCLKGRTDMRSKRYLKGCSEWFGEMSKKDIFCMKHHCQQAVAWRTWFVTQLEPLPKEKLVKCPGLQQSRYEPVKDICALKGSPGSSTKVIYYSWLHSPKIVHAVH